ncbi:transmembrane protein 177 [Hetaerina americana]|uniref:transmembrane protein 177 n=1 Tax=Hetaerina americana TaxID=62018 RepID=UPI003A7F3321
MNIVQMYRMGLGVPVPKKISDRVDQVLEDMKIRKKDRESIKLFTVVGFDMFHAGSTWAKTGCIIGIPKNYGYDSCNDVEKSEIMVNQSLVPWNTPEGKALEESIVLSPEAQKYAIACNVSLCQGPSMFLLSLYPLLATVFAYSISSTLNTKLQLHARKFYVRGVMYSIIGLFSFGLWAFANDFTTSHCEKEADLAACALGAEYALGGVKFYNQVLARNMALRKLMGANGEKVFTAYGNDQITFRQKHMPITERKSLVEKRIKDIAVMEKELLGATK